MNPSSGPAPGSSDPRSPQKDFSFSALKTLESANSLEGDAVNNTGALAGGLSDTPRADAYLAAKEHALKRRRIIGFGLLALAILAGAILIFALQSKQKTASIEQQDASKRYPTTSIPLAELTNGSGATVVNNQVLSVNGQLNVNNALVLTPGVKPTAAVAGQLYFDQTTNKLMYYDGTQFQSVAAGTDIPKVAPTSIGGTSGAIGLGGGLAVTGGTLSNTGVLTLQGQSGNVTLTGGPGLTVNGTTLSNSGLLSLGGQKGDILLGSGLSLSGNTLNAASGVASVVGVGNISVTDDGNGNLTIGTTGQPGMGSVTSSGGTVGRIGMFTGVQNIEDSLISQSGSTITVNGNLSVTGTTTLSTPLAVTSGGTGATTPANARANLGAAKNGANSDITSISGLTTALSVAQGGTGVGTLPTNSVILGNGTSGLNSVVAGAAGLCLVSTGGAPTFTTCPGSGGVASMNGLTGAVSIANASGSGATITINDATTVTKGIASFNATNFLVSSGAVNTVQNIAVSSSPTFAGLTLTAPLPVSSGGTGRNSLASNGVVVGNGTGTVNTVTGSNGDCLVVSAGSPVFTTCPGSGGVASINSQTGAVTIQGIAGSSVSTSSGVITINDASSTVKGLASFNSTNFSVSSGAVNTIQDITTTSAPSFGQLSIVSNQATGKMLTINNTNVAATGNLLDLQQNGTSRLTVAPNGNLTTSGTISSGLVNGQTISSSANFTGSVTVAGNLAVNTIANTGALTVGVGGQSFTLQGNASSTLRSTSGANTTTVGFQSPTANVTYNFAAAAAGTYSLCTTAGNCVGVGGSVTSAGGTTNQLAKFTGSNAIGDSIISDNGSTVTIGGGLSVNTITPTAALTVGATSQNLTLQGSAVTLSSTSGANTNSLVFASPSGGSKTITIPNAAGTVAVSASGPLVLDSLGNITCPTCLTGGGGGGSGVSSLNGLTGALVLQSSDAATFSNSGTTITVSDASSTVKGVAKFDPTNLTVTSGTVNTVQNISVTSTPTFAGLNLTSALTVGNGGTGATSASGARTNLGAAASGANGDITSLSGLTTALSVAQGGTGIATTPTNGQILIGNGTGFSLNTLTAGSGVTISNTAGSITISAPNAGTCAGCANTSLNNLAGVAINTSLLPGVAAGANLGSSVLPFGQLSLAGTSATPATNNFLITGASTGGTRTITLPDASGTIAVSASGNIALSANGDITFAGQLPVANGGTGSNNAGGARTNLGAAASGANSDITSLSGLTTALSVAQGGTGTTSLTANGVLLGNGTSAVTALTGTNGQCLVISGSTPTFTTCPGSGGVASINSQTGVITIQGNDPSSVTTSAGSITINDASTALRGLASFNGTNFTVASGAVNTVQNINTSAAPTFGQLTLTGTNTLSLGTSGAGGNAGSAKFYDGSTNFAGTLNTTTLTANRTIALPDESGTICLQNSTNCGFLTGSAANGSYIQLQASTPGTAQTGNFNITGTGIAGTLQAASIDRASAGTLAIGTTNATTINIGTNNSAHTIAIGTGTGGQTVTIGSTVGASTTTIQGGDGGIIFSQGTSNTGGYAFKANGGQTILTMDYYGRTTHKGLSPSIGSIFQVQDYLGNNLVSVNSNDNVTYVQGGGLYVQSAGAVIDRGLSFSPNNAINYTTPLGTSLNTKINIANYDPGAFNQLIALGLPSTANTTARAITIADARASAHQPTIGVLSPNESQIGGFSWDGSNTNFAVTTSSNTLQFKLNGWGDALTLNDTGTDVAASIGSAGTAAGRLAFKNAGNSNTASIQASSVSTSYITNLPAAIGSANQCLAVSSVASGTQQLGYADCLTTSSGIRNQTTQQTANFNIVSAASGSIGGVIQGAVGQSVDIFQVKSSGGINSLRVGNNGAVSVSSAVAGSVAFTISGATSQTGDLIRLQDSSGNVNGAFNAGGNQLTLGRVAASGTVTQGALVLSDGTTSNFALTLQSANLTANRTVTLPNETGTICLQNSSNCGFLTASNGVQLQASTPGTQQTGNLNISGTGIFGTALTANGNTTITTTSTAALKIQNASSVALLTADTSTGTITLGNSGSGNYITFTAGGGLTAYGTARPTKYISLSAEYAGAVLYGGDTGGANCSTNQNGTMTSGYDTSSSQQSYYNWTSGQASDQCYDVVVRVPLPAGFDGWAAAPSIQVKTDNTGNSTYAIGIIKSDGSTYDTNYGSAYTSPGTLGTSWANMSTSSLDSSGYTAGSYMTIRIRMTAKSNASLQLGDIKLAYYSKY